MGADFTAELANGIGSVHTKLDGMAKGAREAKKAGGELGDQFERAFKLAGRHVHEATEEAEGFQHQLYEVGHAARMAGGPLGELAHKFTGGLRFAGPLAGVAVAAGVASFGLEIYNKIAERHVEQVRQQIEAVEKLSDELYQVDRKAKEGALSSAESNAGPERKMAARGGKEAEDLVNRIADSGQGIERKDIRQAVTKSYDLKGEIRAAAVRAAQTVAASGEMTMTEAMDTIASSPAIQARLHRKKDENQANVGPAAERIILESRHLAPTRENLFQARQELGANTNAGDETGVFAATNQIIGNENLVETRNRKNLTSGVAVAESERKTKRDLNPFTAKLDDLRRSNEIAAEANRKVADAQSAFAAALAEFGKKFGGAGSEQTKARRAANRANATEAEGAREAADYENQPPTNTPLGPGG